MRDIKKVLGLDLGTNSIGFALKNLEVNKEKLYATEDNEDEDKLESAVEEVFDAYGVVVFNMPINMEKGAEVGSLASVRTGFRAKRRLYYRKLVRRIDLLKKLIELNMVPLTEDELINYKKNKVYPTQNAAFVSWLKLDFNRDGKPDFLSPYEVSDETKGVLGENWESTLSSPYQLRALAVERPDLITDEMLGRIAYHFIQRRGYLSNRKDRAIDHKDEEENEEVSENLAIDSYSPKKAEKPKKGKKGEKLVDGDDEGKNSKAEVKKVLDAIKGYEDVLGENLTAGQEIAKRLVAVYDDEGAPQRARNRLGTTNKYGRPIFQKEWQTIIKAKGYNPEESPWIELEKIIFRNRPLKSQKRNIGRCPLEKNKFRMPISHPVYEFSVLWQVVNNVKYSILPKPKKDYSEEDLKKLVATTELSIEQKHNLVSALIQKTGVESEKLASKVAKAIGQREELVITNYDNAKIKLGGTPFIGACRKQLGVEKFERLYQAAIERYFAEESQAKEGAVNLPQRAEVDLFLLWQWMFETETKEDEERLVVRLNEHLGILESETVAILNSVVDGYARFSLKATLNILRFLEKGFRYDRAALLAKLPKLFGYEVWNKKGEVLIAEIESAFEENTKRNRAVDISNEWLASYNRNINTEDPAFMPDRVDPSELDFEVKKALKEILRLRFKNTETEVAGATLADAEKLVEAKLKVGTRLQPYESGKDKAPQQSIYTFGLYLKHSPYEVVVDFINSHTEHQLDYIKKQLYNHSELDVPFKRAKNQPENELPSPITPSIKNPVAIRALNQLKRLINYLIREGKIDPETTAIQLEMSRDLNSANMRKAIAQFQSNQEKEREKARKEIQAHFDETGGGTASDRDILKYRLWEEQGKKCLYTDKEISLTQLLSGEEFDIEHIVPQSRYPTSEMENLCISDFKFNRDIKQATFVADLAEFPEIKKRLKWLEDEIKRLEKKLKPLKKIHASTKESKDKKIVERHVLNMELDYLKQKYKNYTTKEADFAGGFRKRQAHDTSVINKYAIRFLKQKFVVKGSKGAVTAIARKAWELQETDEKKDRSFHYHHAIDAMVQTLLFQRGGEANAYRLITELQRGDGVLYQRYKKALEEAQERKNDVNNKIIQILKKKEFMPFGVKPHTLRRLIKKAEDNILIYHAPLASPLKQTKKALRDKTGKVIKNKNGDTVYQKGSGIRARLHKDSWYGNIKVRNEAGELVERFRKKATVKGLTKADAEKIVDPQLKKEALRLLDLNPKYFETNEYFEIPPSQKTLEKNPYAIGRRVYKVNLFETTVTYPLKIKKQVNPLGVTNLLSQNRLERKQHLYAAKDSNLMMALVEKVDGKKVKRDMIPLAADQFKEGFDPEKLIQPFMKEGFRLKHIFKIGDIVLFYENHPDEIDFNHKKNLKKRLYRITGMVGDDRVPKRQTPQLTFFRLDWAAGDGQVLGYYHDLFKSKEIDNTWKTGRNRYLVSESPIKLYMSQAGLSLIPVNGKALGLHQDGTIKKLAGFEDWVPEVK